MRVGLGSIIVLYRYRDIRLGMVGFGFLILLNPDMSSVVLPGFKSCIEVKVMHFL